MKGYILVLAVLLLGVVSSSAQQSGGTVKGKITYGDGVVLHNVTVQIVQTKQTTETNEDGIFELTNVQPGRYTIIVHLEGFADESRVVNVTAGGSLTADFALKIASLKEQVTVTASGTEISVFDSFQSVNSVGSTRITEKAATSLGDVLDGETGVAKRSFGPGSSRPVIRGFDGVRVLVLVGGLRTGSVGSQSGDHGETVECLHSRWRLGSQRRWVRPPGSVHTHRARPASARANRSRRSCPFRP